MMVDMEAARDDVKYGSSTPSDHKTSLLYGLQEQGEAHLSSTLRSHGHRWQINQSMGAAADTDAYDRSNSR